MPTVVAPTESRIINREKDCCLLKASLWAMKIEKFKRYGF